MQVRQCNIILHLGTLDPAATGLLIVAVGNATKGITQFQQSDKVYSFTTRLGQTTPSYDGASPVLPRQDQHLVAQRIAQLSDEQIQRVCKSMEGANVFQRIPIYSAAQKSGRRLYEIAQRMEREQIKKNREQAIAEVPLAQIIPKDSYFEDRTARGRAFISYEEMKAFEPQLPVKQVSMHQIHYLGRVPCTEPDCIDIQIRAHCSTGTYVRSLGYDIGEVLGVGGYVSVLRRESIGRCLVQNAWRLDELEQMFTLFSPNTKS